MDSSPGYFQDTSGIPKIVFWNETDSWQAFRLARSPFPCALAVISAAKASPEEFPTSKRSMRGPQTERLLSLFRVIVMSPGATSRKRELPSVFSDLIVSSLANPDGTGVEYFRSVNRRR